MRLKNKSKADSTRKINIIFYYLAKNFLYLNVAFSRSLDNIEVCCVTGLEPKKNGGL